MKPIGQPRRVGVLRTMVDDELKRRGHPNLSAGADTFLEYTDLRAGLIQASAAGDASAFPHQTFQASLAGSELRGGVNPLERVLAPRTDDRWRQPILLGIAQLALPSLDLPDRLLSHLVEAPGRGVTQRAFDLLLAQEIATDLGWSWLEQRDPLFPGHRDASPRPWPPPCPNLPCLPASWCGSAQHWPSLAIRAPAGVISRQRWSHCREVRL